MFPKMSKGCAGLFKNKENKQTEVNQTLIKQTTYKEKNKIQRFIYVQKRKSKALRKIRFEKQTIYWQVLFPTLQIL